MRLIDADALVEVLKDPPLYASLGGMTMEGVLMLIDNEAPTIDAVPVVRCKDCRWKADTIGESWCDFHEFTILSDDDFCSDGERKEDE